MSGAYYNEFNPEAAETLENLIKAGLIAPGQVDTRSIEDVRPDDLRGFTQCHFFAGFGVWSYALRRAGWPDDRPVWTGSCPCQPFSAAGKGAAFDDERHLWPAFHHLIKVDRPPVIFGEQVASASVDDWIDLVHADLEALGYTFGSVPFPSAGVGAPHIRDRNFWMANANSSAGRKGRADVRGRLDGSDAQSRSGLGRSSLLVGMAHAGHGDDASQIETASAGQSQTDRSADQPGGRGVSPGGLADADRNGRSAIAIAGIHDAEYYAEPRGGIERLGYAAGADGERHAREILGAEAQVDRKGIEDGRISFGPEYAGSGMGAEQPGPTNGFWRDTDWLGCRDGKWRPVEPGSFPLAYGLPTGMGKLSAGALRLAEVAGLDAASLKRAKSHRIIGLRGAGNAINAEAAIAWIETVMECI